MALTITTEPPSRESIIDPVPTPVPVSDCWKWCLQADDADAVTTPGGYAEVEITIPSTCTVPANGTEVIIWGHVFTVDNSEPYTGTSFTVDAVGLTTALNFVSMIQANLFFNDAVTVTVDAPGSFIVTLTWKECREQARFAAEDMDFTAITALGGSGTATNGASPVYVDGYKVITRLGLLESTFAPLSPKVGITTDQQCTTVGEVCVDYTDDAQSMLFTHLPELTSTSIITSVVNGQSLMRSFMLEYGWVYRDNCQAKSGTIKKSGIVLGINAAFDIDDEFQMRRYWYGHPDGYPSGQFVSDYLTTQPKSNELCWESFAWLWFLNSWQEDQGNYDLVARFSLYDLDGVAEVFDVVINNFGVDGSLSTQPVCFNVSPQYVLDNAPTLTAANLVRYDVTVFGANVSDPEDVLFNACEIMTYLPSHCCDDKTDLYVLTPPGGFATQTIEVLERSIVKDGQEVNIQIDCGTSRSNRAKYGGRNMVNLRTYEKIDFVFRLPNTPESVRWMRHVRQSPQTMIKVYGEGIYSVSTSNKGNPLAKKFIIDPSSVTTYVAGGGLEFKATGYMGDIPTQKGNEP